MRKSAGDAQDGGVEEGANGSATHEELAAERHVLENEGPPALEVGGQEGEDAMGDTPPTPVPNGQNRSSLLMTITTAGTTAMEGKAKERLYRLVDQIPEGEVHAAERFLEYLAVGPVLRSLMNAPEDDEPVTPEEEEAQREAIEDVAAGRMHSLEEVKQELGLR